MGQLYYKNIHREFFESYPKAATDFFAISGYIGPDPVAKLLDLPFNSKIIYGLQREIVNPLLHNQLQKIHSDKVSILYATIPSHSKCYIWTSGDKPLRGFVGSANFSSNGLYNDYRETLLEVDTPDLHAIWGYIKLIAQSSTICTDVAAQLELPPSQATDGKCKMPLYDPRTGEVQDFSGLNWGFSNGNVKPNDAYIPIRMDHIRTYPQLFPPVFFDPEQGHRSRALKECVELIWDDGFVMEALFEGSQPGNELIYPKQISSIPSKDILGKYIRYRLGLSPVSENRHPSEKITRPMLEAYGRNYITLSLIQTGVYSADFSRP